MFKPGDIVVIKTPFFHFGTNLGGRTGVVKSTDSYILVDVTCYDHNPVKCLRNEVKIPSLPSSKKEDKDYFDELDDILDEIFPT